MTEVKSEYSTEYGCSEAENINISYELAKAGNVAIKCL